MTNMTILKLPFILSDDEVKILYAYFQSNRAARISEESDPKILNMIRALKAHIEAREND